MCCRGTKIEWPHNTDDRFRQVLPLGQLQLYCGTFMLGRYDSCHTHSLQVPWHVHVRDTLVTIIYWKNHVMSYNVQYNENIYGYADLYKEYSRFYGEGVLVVDYKHHKTSLNVINHTLGQQLCRGWVSIRLTACCLAHYVRKCTVQWNLWNKDTFSTGHECPFSEMPFFRGVLFSEVSSFQGVNSSEKIIVGPVVASIFHRMSLFYRAAIHRFHCKSLG
jgi:hypothetical protein